MAGHNSGQRRKRLRVFLVVSLFSLLWPVFFLSSEEIIENAGYAGPKITLRYALWGGAGEVEYSREICRRFVQQYPSLRLSVAVYPWGQYWAKLQTQTAAGLAPDIISFYTFNLGVWVTRGALRALDDLVASSRFDLGNFHQAAVKVCTWNGQLYCLPVEIPMRVLVFSLDRFQERGLPEHLWPQPDRPLNWEEFKQLCRWLTIREKDGTFKQYGFGVGPHWNELMSGIYGGRMVDRLVNPTRSAVSGNEALKRGLIEIFSCQYGERTTLGSIPLAAGAWGGTHLLLSPKFAMTIAGPWDLPALKKAGVRFGLSPLPRATHCPQMIDVNGVALSATCRHPQEAWTFLQFLASPEIQPIFGRRLKGIPALKSASQALLDNDFGISGCQAFLVDLKEASPNLTSSNSYLPQAIEKWLSETEQILDARYQEAWQGLPLKERSQPLRQRQFAVQMSNFVQTTISQRLALLDREITRAFQRARVKKPGLMVGVVIPLMLSLGAVLAFLFYLRKVREHARQSPAGHHCRQLTGYGFLSPWLAGFVLFTAGPILAAFVLSFTDWNMVKPPGWVGASNYLQMFTEKTFYLGLWRTFHYALLAIPISLTGGLFTAALLTFQIRGTDFFKAVFYFPSLFTGAEAAVLWVNMFNREYGIVNRILGFLKIPPVSWLDQAHAFTTVVLMNFFWVGSSMIVYYAAMKQIPRQLYEAAEMDGANFFQKFFHITMPLLSPVILFMVVVTTIGAFQVFTPALFFAPDSTTIGSPGNALRFYAVNIYDLAFNNLQMGQACSYAVFLFLVIFVITLLQLKLSRRYVYTEEKS